MSDFDYGNGRLRARKSRLLTREQMESLLSSRSLDNMLAALVDTPYRLDVEAALVQYQGLPCLQNALRKNIIITMGDIRRFYDESAGELVTTLLQRYDVHNIKALLRGVSQQSSVDAMIGLTFPVNKLQPGTLEQLARASEPRQIIDLLATWQSPLAQPLMEQRTRFPNCELFMLELALDRWYWKQALSVDPKNKVWQGWQEMSVDVINLMTALRLVGQPAVEPILASQLGNRDTVNEQTAVSTLFFGPGKVSLEKCVRITEQETVAAAVETGVDTAYGPVLAAALPNYERNGRLSHFERALTVYQFQQAVRLIIEDPLGVGVVIGYLALKQNEITNLRHIGQGLHLQESPAAIRERLIFAQ